MKIRLKLIVDSIFYLIFFGVKSGSDGQTNKQTTLSLTDTFSWKETTKDSNFD